MPFDMQQLGPLMDAKRTLCAHNNCPNDRDCSTCKGAQLVSDAMDKYLDSVKVTDVEHFENDIYRSQALDRTTAKTLLCDYCDDKACDGCRVATLANKTLTQEQLSEILAAKLVFCDYCKGLYKCEDCLVAKLTQAALREFDDNDQPDDNGKTTVIHDPEQKAAILKNDALLRAKQSHLAIIK